MLVVNYVDITDMNDDNYELFRSAVSEERRAKAERFHFMDDSKRCICAELLLSYSLFRAVGRLVKIDIAYNEYGKPFLKQMNDFSYNITHSGKWVAVAYGCTEVGIDIEEIQAGKEDIADRFFSESEINYIHAVTGKEQTERFTQIWTLKECYIKYLGTGLSTELNSFSVDTLRGVLTNQDGGAPKDLRLESYHLGTDYYLSVCTREDEVVINQIRIEDLIQFRIEQFR